MSFVFDVVSVVIVFVGSLTTIGMALRNGWAWGLAVDVPNERSLHTRPIPRVGGILIMPWVLLSLGVVSDFWLLAALAGVLCLVSFLDDRVGLAVPVRFAIHFLLATTFSILVGYEDIAVLLPMVLLIVWSLNLFNFMDGSDGLAGGMAMFGFGAYAMAASFTAGNNEVFFGSVSVLLGAASFLWFNFPPARVFLGDAGSTSFGFLAAAFGVLGWRSGVWPVWFPFLVFSPFLADATVTLAKRGFAGKRIWQAHKDHYYQRLVRLGWGHRRTALLEYIVMVSGAVLGVTLLSCQEHLQYWGFIVWALLLAVKMVLIDIAWKSSAESH